MRTASSSVLYSAQLWRAPQSGGIGLPEKGMILWLSLPASLGLCLSEKAVGSQESQNNNVPLDFPDALREWLRAS